MRNHCLFTYGTLTSPKLIRELLGIQPANIAAEINGYKALFFTNKCYPGLAIKRGAITHGLVYYPLTIKQLRRLDKYEGREYKRVLVNVHTESNHPTLCWIYMTKPSAKKLLTKIPWSSDS